MRTALRVLELDAWTCTTERLLIRPALPGDAAAIHAVRQTAPFQPQGRSIAGFRAMVVDMRKVAIGGESGWQQFVMLSKADGALVGDIGVNFGNPSVEQAEIGFTLHTDAQGQGLAAEGIGRMADHLLGEHGLHRLVAFCDIRNRAAHRLLSRLRFRQEGHHRAAWRVNGDWIDELSFARLAGE
ncbi:GNAT family N-acetyltransferase [Sandaracinobacteroides saxicola]|uniref:GNAT family N-acetyltransferase n=1 Tax=Sandaracinobacteroides saxicola TaxID=2759707 RepID=A0A7G5IEN0_9SPHN|nr:GNAT family protein [Sandaracinobacteroides saxicola]QMW21822.1 GNAT family N-acetyltransferase [Sandaracinobacteroides saxicola]